MPINLSTLSRFWLAVTTSIKTHREQRASDAGPVLEHAQDSCSTDDILLTWPQSIPTSAALPHNSSSHGSRAPSLLSVYLHMQGRWRMHRASFQWKSGLLWADFFWQCCCNGLQYYSRWAHVLLTANVRPLL